MGESSNPESIHDTARSVEDLVTRLHQANAGMRATIEEGRRIVQQSRELIDALPFMPRSPEPDNRDDDDQPR